MLMDAQLKAKKTFTSKQKEVSPAIVTVPSPLQPLPSLLPLFFKSDSDLVKKIALESDRARYWCEVFLIYPLLPFCKALSTITVGGVIVNASSTACNTKLQRTCRYQDYHPTDTFQCLCRELWFSVIFS